MLHTIMMKTVCSIPITAWKLGYMPPIMSFKVYTLLFSLTLVFALFKNLFHKYLVSISCVPGTVSAFEILH